jgi:hypothetical protein
MDLGNKFSVSINFQSNQPSQITTNSDVSQKTSLLTLVFFNFMYYMRKVTACLKK